MNVAYVDHGYHDKTKSTQFIFEFLRRNSANVDVFSDHSLIGEAGVDPKRVLEGNYDLIVVFQMERIAEWVARRVPERLVFIPMYDGARDLEDDYWKIFKNSRILNFSYTLHEKLQRIGVPSLLVQYFPDPSAFARVDFSELHGFFWQRRQEIAWPLIKRLIGTARFRGLTLHLALDPGAGDPQVPSDDEVRVFNVALSRWQDDRAAFDQLMERSNIYFAPRTCEGIGMSFLEAMARGQCVVAPDGPTMSEYMTHGVSGLLYNENAPHALDFGKAAEIGAAARRNVEHGFVKWQKDQQEILPTFFFGGREAAYALSKTLAYNYDKPQISSLNIDVESRRRRKQPDVAIPSEKPLVTVAMVTRNARETFNATFESIASQTYENLEFVIVDGASTDGTLELFAEKADDIDRWISEPDRGPFDGMNKAAGLATGRYILFMNSGDLFATKESLAVAMDGVSDTNEPDFIVGHHIYVTRGFAELHKANDFDETWRAMREGAFSWKALSGVPCHQATLTRTALLREHGYDLSWRITADHDFMYRMRSKGAKFHNCDATLAIYFGGGFSAQNEALCHEEWRRQICIYGEKDNADRMFATAPARFEVKGAYKIWDKITHEYRRIIRQIGNVVTPAR